jgi:ring-1,2-phenylacetyl-CoA epoxidase subunit PaaC
MLADDRLILSHRLSELCGHGPSLEEDIALTNVALDLLGQANELLTYAAEIDGNKTADDLAYLRSDVEFKNTIITELENGDFAFIIVRQFFFDIYSYFLFSELIKSKDERIAAIAEKSLKEVTYHLRHSKKWFHILSEGTEESRTRLIDAIDELWSYSNELLDSNEIIDSLESENIAPNMTNIKSNWHKMIKENFEQLNLQIPDITWFHSGGRVGKHSESLGGVLTDMQYLQRAIPNAEW